MERAPVIVVGTALAVEKDASRPRAETRDGRILESIRVEIELERVLRGDKRLGLENRAGQKLGFFVWVDTVPSASSFACEPGVRRIFFLKQEKEWRQAGEIYDFSLRVRSGRARETRIIYESPRSAIAETLLQPSLGMDTGHFAKGLSEAARAADYFSSRPYTRYLLRQLLGHGDASVRASACRLLVDRYHEDASCLAGGAEMNEALKKKSNGTRQTTKPSTQSSSSHQHHYDPSASKARPSTR